MTVSGRSSPVRRLYDLLCTIEGHDGPAVVDENLAALEDYSCGVGDPAPRFCEWAYGRIERRGLAEGLLGTVLRPTDANRLAKRVGCELAEYRDLPPEPTIRLALNRLGLREPTPPHALQGGVRELREAYEWLSALVKDGGSETLAPVFRDGDVYSTCRRGAERLLRVNAVFFWDSVGAATMRRVMDASLHDFRGPDLAPGEISQWLLKRAELGSLNHLLRATSAELRGMPVPFLPSEAELWPDAAFQVFNHLGTVLGDSVHDKRPGAPEDVQPDLPGRMSVALEKVLKNIDAEPVRIWRPRTIQFFRRIQDTQGRHCEGLDERGETIRFFELSQELDLDLHRPYLFASATTPSVIDFACAPLREELTRPV